MTAVTVLVAITVLLCLGMAMAGLHYGRKIIKDARAASITIFTSGAFFSVGCIITMLMCAADNTPIACYMITCLILTLSTFTGFMGIGYRATP